MTTTMTRTSVTTHKPVSTAAFVPSQRVSNKPQKEKRDNAITLLMGQPVTAPCLIPVLHSSTPSCINNPFMVSGDCYNLTAMSFGSPHGAVFVDDLDALDIDTVGAALSSHVLFPKGANIVFVQAQDADARSLNAKLWHREDGNATYTAEAVSVAGTAALMLQKVLGTSASISMGGENFLVKWDRCGDGVSVTGPTTMV